MFLDLLEKTIQEEKKYYYREHTAKQNSRDYKDVENGHRPDSSYVRETIQVENEKERRQLPRQLPAKTQRRLSEHSSENNITPQINTAHGEGMLNVCNRQLFPMWVPPYIKVINSSEIIIPILNFIFRTQWKHHRCPC